MTRYTVAICNLNMAETIEASLCSILNQLDDEYEVLVVDDGSTDGSLEIIQRLESEYPNLGHIVGSNDNIAEARNQSFQEACGEYILESLDMDDRYDDAIQDFVEVFKQLDSSVEGDFYLKGHSINIAPKDLHLSFPFRSMTYGEDPDRWRRLLAAGKIIWLQHEPFYENLDPDDRATIKEKSRMIKTAEFRSGVTFGSYVQYYLERESLPSALYKTGKLIRPYLTAVHRGRYSLPAGYEKKAKLNETIAEKAMTLREVEAEFGFDFDRHALSPRGEEVFFESTELSPLSEY